MLKTCPELVEVQEVQFKLHCRLQLFDGSNQDSWRKKQSLISCASRYGLLFVGSHLPNLQAIQLKCVENYTPKDKDISNYPRRNVPLPSGASHVSVNCDCTILAVVVEKDKCPTVVFFDVLSFYKESVRVIKGLRLSATPGTCIIEIGWNPTMPAIFTACKSDGSLGVYEIKGDTVDINEIPAAAVASCFCWSPKGKQLAVGSARGQITQYKPDLKAVKVINAPPLEGPHQLLSLQWISSYQFAGLYQPHREDGQAKLIVVDAPKTGETTYTDYDDVCYSGTSRTPQFFMMFLQQWNLLLVASANSSELAALGYISDSWTQYIIGDAARAELPLNNGEDTFPVGLCLDVGNTRPLPWGEGAIPPCPYVLMLNHAGLLCLYDLVNLKEGLPSICAPPDPVQDTSGLRYFVSEMEKGAQTRTEEPPAASAPPVSSQPSFGSLATNQAPTQPLNFSQPPATQASLFGKPLTSLVDTTKQGQPSIFTGQLTSTQPLFGQTDMAKSMSGAPVQALNLTSTAATTTGITKPSLIAPTPVVANASMTSIFGATQTSAPTAISLGTKVVTVPSLFGGQTTITTAKSQPSAATSDKYGAILSALNNPPAATTGQNRPIIVRTAKPEPKPQVKQPVPVIASALPASQETNAPDNSAVDDVSSTMIRRECAALEAELKGLLLQGRGVDVNIGTENEKTYITEKITELQEFIKEIDDVIRDEQDEVHCLKGDLILSWAQYEEAQSHYNVSKDRLEALLTKSQPLDTATEKRQANMRRLTYYIESQLTQAGKALDEQWDSFQDYAKKTYRVQTPTMESIYQTMVRVNAIMQRQNYIIKDASNSLKRRSKSAKGPCLLLSLDNATGIEESLERLQIDEDSAKRHLYEKALKQAQALTKTKTDKLRSFLKNREVGHVTALKPELSASILQTPPNRKPEAISILGGHMTPIEKPGVVRSLDFIQSTPIQKAASVDLIKVPPNTPVQVDPQKTFGFKSADLSISSLIQSSAAPVSKPSAFVPTSQGSSAFNFSAANTNGQTSKTTSLFTFGSNVTVTTTATSKPDSASLSFSKPVSFGSTFSFANTASSTTVTNKPTPVFATPPTKCTILGGGTTAPFAAKLQGTDTKPDVSVLPLTSKSSSESSSKSVTFTSSVSSSTASGFQFGSAAVKVTETEKPQIKPATAPAKVMPAPQSIVQPSVAPGTSTVTQPAMGALFGNSVPISVPSAVKSSSVAPTALVIPTVSSTLPTTTSAFGALPVFGTSTASTPSGTSPLASAASKTTSSSIFGTAATTSSTTGSIFGSTATTAQSTFGLTSSNTQPLFSSMNAAASATTTTSVFGAASIFGNASATTTTVPSIFGASTAASITAPSTFAVASTTVETTGQFTIAAAVTAAATTNTQSIFGATPSSVVAGSSPIFGSTAAATATTSTTSIFGGASTTPVASSQSIFGSTAATNSSSTSIFGTASAAVSGQQAFGSTPTAATTTASIFGASSTTAGTASVFSGTATSQVTTVAASAQSIFGSTAAATSPATSAQPNFGSAAAATTAATSTQSIFGSTAAATSAVTSTQPIFGSAATASSAVTSAQSIFGSTAAATTGAFSSSSSIFGSQTPATTQPSVFGAGATAKPLFGSTTAAPQSGIFGGSTPSTNQTSVFGATSTATTSASVFGGAAPVSTQGSIFGTPVTQNSVFGSPATTQTSIFGGATTTKQSSVFGTPTTTPFGASSPFGQTSSVFGTATTTSSAFGSSPFGSPSVFGSAPATTASVFGQPAAFGQNTTSVFGTSTAPNSPFGATNSPSTFGTASSAGSVFGQPAASSFSFANAGSTGNTGAFGFGGLNMGNNASTTSSSIFGGNSFEQNTTASNPFSRATDAKPAFGASGGSIFGGTAASSTGSIFGSNTSSGFGGTQSSTFGSPGAFGQQSSFGQPSAFGASSQPGPFSGGGTGVGQTGFGSPGAFQKPASGFGAAPVFGGSPQQGFGAAPSFGGSPAFGSAPAFGSPNKVFGSSTPTAAFGASTTGSPGFGNLANQNTIGFGNLAQQAPTSSAGGFSGNSSFSNWR